MILWFAILICFCLFFFFFFQAEDGIRDVAVTGVQTCALPISRPESAPRAGGSGVGAGGSLAAEGREMITRWLPAHAISRQSPHTHSRISEPAAHRDRDADPVGTLRYRDPTEGGAAPQHGDGESGAFVHPRCVQRVEHARCDNAGVREQDRVYPHAVVGFAPHAVAILQDPDERVPVAKPFRSK